MKATNYPSDKMTIKNNNGDLLLEIDAEGVKSIKFKDGNEITGKDISDAVEKAGDATKVTANPTLAGTEAALEGLQVGNTKYKVGGEIGSITILPADLPTTFTAIVSWLASISGGWNLKHFELTESETATVAAKLVEAYAINENNAFMYFGGNLATMANFSGHSGSLSVSILNITLPSPLSGTFALFFNILTGIDDIITFDIFAAPVTVAT